MSPWVRRRKRKRIKVVPILFCAALCLLAGLLRQAVQTRKAFEPGPAVPTFSSANNPTSLPSPIRSKRLVYRYSVIPGGVRDSGELISEVNRDPVVAAHFRDFNSAEARIVPLQNEMYVHVSYRIVDKVFWTAKKIRLAPGEEMITDGRSQARTRCGNRVSVLSQEPTSPEEPAVESLEVPLEEESPPRFEIAVQPGLPEGRPFSLLPPSLTEQWIVPPSAEWPYFPAPLHTLPERYYVPPTSSEEPPPANPAVIPEPGTLILLASGLAAQLLIWRMQRK